MAQHYSDPKRATGAYTLPDLEVWEDYITIVRSQCGEFEVARESADARGFCPSCERATCVLELVPDQSETGIQHTDRTGWFYWFCFPGCMPDSSLYGPFASEREALDDAREQAGTDDDDDSDDDSE